MDCIVLFPTGPKICSNFSDVWLVLSKYNSITTDFLSRQPPPPQAQTHLQGSGSLELGQFHYSLTHYPHSPTILTLLTTLISNLTTPIVGNSGMPASTASANVERKATSAVPPRPAPAPSPSAGEPNKVRTRSSADPQTQVKLPKKYYKARKFLSVNQLLEEHTPCTALNIAIALTSLAESYKIPESVAKAVGHLAKVLRYTEQHAQSTSNNIDLPVLMKELQSNISAEMESRLSALENKLTLPTAVQKQLESVAKELGQATDTIKTSLKVVGNSIAQATDTSSQLANTASSYKDALLRSREQPQLAENTSSATPADPRILRDMDRKVRQILIDTMDPDITGASNTAIKDKVSAAINNITDPPPPKDTTILDITKLRKGGFTVLFKDKEVINWLQDPAVDLEFTSGVSRDATIVKRIYSLLVPRIPTTLDPTNETHLREIEECNGLPTGTIVKARWVKPEYRRAPDQRATHTIFALRDADNANICIRDGIKVCGLHTRPNRLKHEPMQCMKCRKWGHFANVCTATTDTCGTCGGEHRTKECDNKVKNYCVSCRSHEHASWDRECPEFQRRCGQYDENYPKNNLIFFPTEESWTLTTRPQRLPHSDRFPPRYAATPRQQTERPTRENASKPQNKQRKQQTTRNVANQTTLDQYIASESTQRHLNAGTIPNLNPADAAAPTDPTHPSLDLPDWGAEPHPQGWN